MKLKKVFELLFIFLLPLIILIFNFDFKKQNEYDASSNLIGSKNYIEFESPFSDYKDNTNIYINTLNIKQLLSTNTATIDNLLSVDNGIYHFEGTTSSSDYYYALSGTIILDSSHYYYIYVNPILNNGIDKCMVYGYIDNNPIYNIGNRKIININTLQLLFVADRETSFNVSFSCQLFDLTEIFGDYAETLTTEHINNYLDLPFIYVYNTLYVKKLIMNEIITNNWDYNFTLWGRFFNFLNEDLHITDNFILRFSVSYCMLAIINIFIWNLVFYTLTLLFKIILFKRE